MSLAWTSLLLVGGLACGATATGRALAGLLSIRLLRRRTAESFAASAFLGTAGWILVFGWCSYLGLAARPAAAVVIGLSGLLTAALALRRRLSWLLPPRRPAAWLTLAVPSAAAVLVTLLPVLLRNCVNPFNDTAAYVATSEWLQGHGFGTACAADPCPFALTDTVAHFQAIGHRMGPLFLLALVQALWPGALALEVYPAVTTWGVVLNVLGVYLLCRWSFGCRPSLAFTGALLAATCATPLAYSAAAGFFCQVYGMAALSFSLAVLSRLLAPVRWKADGAFLGGAACALQLSVYSEMAPLLAAACLGCLAAAAVRAARTSRRTQFVRFGALSIALVAVLGNVEILRACRALPHQAAALYGWHVPWSDADFWAYAVGMKPHSVRLSTGRIVAAAAATLAALTGLARANRRGLPPVVALAALTGLAACFRFLARDPWTGTVGHTWDLLKVCQWGFPVVLGAQCAGMNLLLRRSRPRRVVVAALCLILAAWSAPAHGRFALWTITDTESKLGRPDSVAALKAFRREVADSGATAVCFVADGEGVWRARVLSTALGRWPVYDGVISSGLPEGTTFVVAPFRQGIRPVSPARAKHTGDSATTGRRRRRQASRPCRRNSGPGWRSVPRSRRSLCPGR